MRGPGFFCFGRTRQSMKEDKAAVDYSRGMRTRHCSICLFWLGENKCSRVAGYIRPDYWCKRWKSRSRARNVNRERTGSAARGDDFAFRS